MTNALFHEKTIQGLQNFITSEHHALVLRAQYAEPVIALLTQVASAELPAHVVLPIMPDGGSIKIETVRELKRSLSLKQLQDQMRFVVFHEAHTMTTDAQNSLLKLLEEPPGGVKFVLFTPSPNTLLATILSRSSTLNLLPVQLEHAQAHYPKPADEIKRAYALSDGAPDMLFALLHVQDDEQLQVLNVAKELIRMKPPDRLTRVDQLARERGQLHMLLQAMDDVLRAVLHGQAKNQPTSAKNLALKRKVVLDAQKSLEKSVNAKLLLSDVFMSI